MILTFSFALKLRALQGRPGVQQEGGGGVLYQNNVAAFQEFIYFSSFGENQNPLILIQLPSLH